jgi:hypothetical protein
MGIVESHHILHHSLQGMEFGFNFCEVEVGLVTYQLKHKTHAIKERDTYSQVSLSTGYPDMGDHH